MPKGVEPDIVEKSVKNFKPTYRPPLTHIVMGVLFILMLFWNDVVHNKLLDRGYNVELTVVKGLTLHAGTLWYATLLMLFAIMLVYMLHEVVSRGTLFFDVVMGSVGILGLGVMYAMTLMMLSNIQMVPFFAFSVSSIGLYHFGGIAIEIVVALYFTFTT